MSTYRSIIVIIGATRDPAAAAAVKSAPSLKPRFRVFQDGAVDFPIGSILLVMAEGLQLSTWTETGEAVASRDEATTRRVLSSPMTPSSFVGSDVRNKTYGHKFQGTDAIGKGSAGWRVDNCSCDGYDSNGVIQEILSRKRPTRRLRLPVGQSSWIGKHA